jgi:cholesterol 7-dehydrogenase
MLDRKRGNLPPPFPNSWFRILFSYELKKGEAKHVSVLGQQLVVFRSEDGAVRLAFCLDHLKEV